MKISPLPHINNTCKTAFYYIHNIRRIRKYLSVETKRTLVHAVVIGRLDYCNSLFYGLPMKSVSKLQHVQNAAAGLITNTPRYDHISPALRSLHFCSVATGKGKTVTLKILTLSFKAIHGFVPDYIQSLVTLCKNILVFMFFRIFVLFKFCQTYLQWRSVFSYACADCT